MLKIVPHKESICFNFENNEEKQFFDKAKRSDIIRNNNSVFLHKILSIKNQSLLNYTLKKVQSQIEDYLKRYKIISQGVRQRYQSLVQTLPNQSENARRYQAVKSYNENVQSIQDLLKEGYLYVDALREAFTGESISYRIGIKENINLHGGDM